MNWYIILEQSKHSIDINGFTLLLLAVAAIAVNNSNGHQPAWLPYLPGPSPRPHILWSIAAMNLKAYGCEEGTDLHVTILVQELNKSYPKFPSTELWLNHNFKKI